MSVISRLFYYKSVELDIEASKESLEQLEALTEELNRRQKEIQSYEKMMRSASDSLEPPMWGKDLDNRFVFLNPTCAEHILRTTIQAALHMTDADFDRNALAQVCADSDMVVKLSMETHRFIEHARYADGSDVWLDTTKSPWIVNGKLVGTVGVGRNITNNIPEDVREKYKEPGYVDIDVNLMYNPEDIKRIMEGIL